MQRFIFICFATVALIHSLSGQSLVPEVFNGHIINTGSVSTGDIIMIEITQDMNLKLRSVQSSSQSVFFELSGGEGNNLLSFMPSGQSSGTKSLESEESVSFTATLAVLIDSIDENSLALVSGYRIFEAVGGRQELRLSGSLPVASLTPGSTVPFTRLLNARISYMNILSPSQTFLSEEDIASVADFGTPVEDETMPEDTEGVIADEAAAVDEATDQIPSDTAAVAVPPEQQGGTRLSDERKRELFLQYMNDFMRLIFM